MLDLVSNHQITTAIASLYVLFAVINALPVPIDQSGRSYRFAFSFLHSLGANLMKSSKVREIVGDKPAAV